MTERDDTTPIRDTEAADERSHRYPGGPGRTDVVHDETRAFPGGFRFSDGTAPAATQSTRERRRGAGIGVLVGALVLGGGAGFAGAAAYDTWSGNDAGTTSSNATSTTNTSVTPIESMGSVQEVAASVLPSVVKIDVAGTQAQGSGSGIVLSEEGEILTNHHVVEPAGENGRLTVAFADGSTAPARVVGSDPLTDTAVIQVEGVTDLTPADIGSSGGLSVGEQVVAVGSPFGLEATVTSGIVSALDRPVSAGSEDGTLRSTYPAIQTDAAINPGNSGGPLVNMAGQVVGINSSIRTSGGGSPFGGGGSGSIGLGFAIPIDKVAPIVEQLRAGEAATHARLGVSVQDEVGESGNRIGALVAGVEDGSAAADAGIAEGDVITRVGDTLISGSESLVATIRGFRPDDEVTLVLMRDGEEQTLTVPLGSDNGVIPEPAEPAEPPAQEEPEQDGPPSLRDFFED
ncbi:MAG: trypsin-like peptidase domain-containing protein [Nocardioides sp.]|nr:trypsin-like peptidase domain-containing protein [Nocardioides sp.]